MGKRSKVRNAPNEDSIISKKKLKIKKNTSEDNTVSTIEETDIIVAPIVKKKAKKTTEVVNVQSKSKESKKSKKIKIIDDEPQEETNKNIVATEEKKSKKSKEIVNDNIKSKSGKSRKIVFVDDEPQDVPATSGTTNNGGKKKKFMNEDEADVKEEDIDKFCDELDEEDNRQYENWVKLIEANFHSNKKT